MEEKKKTTRTRKTTSSRVKKNELNETISAISDEKKVVINSALDDNKIECVNCHEKFDRGYTICPHCHKRQSSFEITFFVVFACVFLFAILVFHFVAKFAESKETHDDYKVTCVLVDYENLVRHPKDYKNKDIKMIGKVVSVEGVDDGYSNDMYITINANLFENGEERLITIEYSDKTYDIGFIEGDNIIAYGQYDKINGNVPNIKAKVIEFGK